MSFPYVLRLRLALGVLVLVATTALVGVTARPASAAPLACSTYRGAFVFVRPGGANGLGHVGWGYRVTCTGTFYFGSVENPSGRPHVAPGGDNGFWWQSGTESQMLSTMRSRGYNAYKTILTAYAQFDPTPATNVAAGSAGRGYDVIGNNCADNTWDVLQAYGVPNLPYLQLYPAPNDWYAQLTDTVNVDWTVSQAL